MSWSSQRTCTPIAAARNNSGASRRRIARPVATECFPVILFLAAPRCAAGVKMGDPQYIISVASERWEKNNDRALRLEPLDVLIECSPVGTRLRQGSECNRVRTGAAVVRQFPCSALGNRPDWDGPFAKVPTSHGKPDNRATRGDAVE